MTYFQRDFRIPRLKTARALFTRRGLVLRLRIETDSPIVASVDLAPRSRKPRWRDPEEAWARAAQWEALGEGPASMS